MPTASPVARGYEGNLEGHQVNYRLPIQIKIQISACILMHFKKANTNTIRVVENVNTKPDTNTVRED